MVTENTGDGAAVVRIVGRGRRRRRRGRGRAVMMMMVMVVGGILQVLVHVVRGRGRRVGVLRAGGGMVAVGGSRGCSCSGGRCGRGRVTVPTGRDRAAAAAAGAATATAAAATSTATPAAGRHAVVALIRVLLLLLLLLRGARLLAAARDIGGLVITFSLLHLAGRAVRAGRAAVAAVVGAVVLLMGRRGRAVMMAEHHRRLDVAAAGAGRERVLMVHEGAHYRGVRDRRLVIAGRATAQPGERIAAVVVVVGARRVVVVRAGGRAGSYAVGRGVLGRCRREGE